MTKFSKNVLYKLIKKAFEREDYPTLANMIYNIYVKNAERGGKPSISWEKQQEIAAKASRDWYRRERFTAKIVV